MLKQINKNKGTSLSVLIITIIVFLILLTTITFSADNIVNSTKKRHFAKEIYEIQKLVDRYRYENNDYPYIVENDKKNTIDVTINENELQFEGEDIVDNSLTLYPINLVKAGVENLSRGTKKDGDEKDVYAFSDKTGKIYYVKGYKVSTNIYYTLTDDLKKAIGKR